MNKVANPRVAGGLGGTALHGSAQGGHLAVAKLLVKVGADLEVAMPSGGSKPLSVAAENGHAVVVRYLIEARANTNSRAVDGLTPLDKAAVHGHFRVVKVLLRAEANALLTFSSPSANPLVHPDLAAQKGHLEVVRGLIQEYGIGLGRCSGANGGLEALQADAEKQRVDIMAELRDAGVIDTGQALLSAAKHGREASVKFLLQQKDMPGGGGVGYLSCLESMMSRTPLLLRC